MRIDELTRELHVQGQEAMADAPVGMGALRDRRSRERRRKTTVGGAFGVLVVVAGGVWLGGGQAPVGTERPDSGQTGFVDHPGPVEQDTPPSTETASTAWRAVVCNRPEFGGCAVPVRLRLAGSTYADRFGGVQPVHAPNGINRELSLSTSPVRSARLVLVGATGTGPRSRLEVTIDGGPPRDLPPGPLTALLFPDAHEPQEVLVREVGTPGKHEVLRIEAYAVTTGPSSASEESE